MRETTDEIGCDYSFGVVFIAPGALLLIESQVEGASAPMWNYGLARMTLCEVTVKLDDNQVWHVPYFFPQGPDRPSKFDTWLFFYEAEVNSEAR